MMRQTALTIFLVFCALACDQGTADGEFEIRVAGCSSNEPVFFALLYTRDGASSCFVGPCAEESVPGCIEGVMTPELDAGEEFELEVGMYRSGNPPQAVGCSAPITVEAKAGSVAAVEIACSNVGSCPLPPENGCTMLGP